MVSACCRGHYSISSPPHQSPDQEYKSFPGGILGSDGESDPFDSSSPPEGDTGRDSYSLPFRTGHLFLEDTTWFRTLFRTPF